MNKKPLIPFGWWPGHWGLKGKTREIARAEYELSGYELEKRLIELTLADEPEKLSLQLLDHQKRSKQIDDLEYEINKARILYKDIELEIKLLEIDLSFEKITQAQFDQRKANLLKEPWVSMPVINWNPDISQRTYFQLDYNEYFLDFLKSNGYDGDEDTIINNWLNDICISIAEEINGMDRDLITPSRRRPLDENTSE